MKRRQMGYLGLGMVLVLAYLATLGAATQSGEDPVLGTWHLAVDKSIYGNLPPPKTEQRTYRAHPAGVQATITTVDAAGATRMVSYVSDYDSVEYPVVGSAIVDTITWLPINPNTAEARSASSDNADPPTSERYYLYFRAPSGFWIRRVECSRVSHAGPATMQGRKVDGHDGLPEDVAARMR